MATKPWRATGLLTHPGEAGLLARRLTRRDWRRLRKLLARPDLPGILEALRNEMQRRQRIGARPPVPWTQAAALKALATQQDRASLFGAIRLLQAAAPGSESLGYAIAPDQEPVRIDQALLLGFAGREVEAVAAPLSGRTPGTGWTGRPVLTQNAVGLLGPNGPMPAAWSHQVRGLPSGGKVQARQSFLGFLNLVQRRQLSLLYRAWSDALPVTAWDTGGARQHPIEQRLSALAGLAHAQLETQDAVPAGFKKAFAVTLRRQVRSPGPLAAMLSKYLGHEVSVREFSARWLEIPAEERTRLGVRCTRLGVWSEKVADPLSPEPVWRHSAGEEAVLGQRTWDCSTRFDLIVGPVDLSTYMQLLPGRPLHEELRDLVALYMGPEWDWRLIPVLKAEQVPRGDLGRPPAHLGWTQWLGRRQAGLPADDLELPVRPELAPRRSAPVQSASWVDPS